MIHQSMNLTKRIELMRSIYLKKLILACFFILHTGVVFASESAKDTETNNTTTESNSHTEPVLEVSKSNLSNIIFSSIALGASGTLTLSHAMIGSEVGLVAGGVAMGLSAYLCKKSLSKISSKKIQ